MCLLRESVLAVNLRQLAHGSGNLLSNLVIHCLQVFGKRLCNIAIPSRLPVETMSVKVLPHPGSLLAVKLPPSNAAR